MVRAKKKLLSDIEALRKRAREHIVAERVAIDGCREMIADVGSADPTTRRRLEDLATRLTELG